MSEKTTRTKVSTIYRNNLKMEEKVITNLPNFHYKSEIKVNNKKYEIEIKFQESRYKHQAWLIYDDKKISLSFFDSQKIAKTQILSTIAYMNGVSGEQSNNNQVVGD